MTGVDFVPSATAPTDHAGLRAWVEDWAAVLEPERVHWCDGSDEEDEQLCAGLVAAGTFTRLDDELRPNSYWARSDPGDVARVEDRTFICSAARGRRADEQLARPGRMRGELRALFAGRDARAHALRRAVLDGPARLADRAHRRPADRLGLRRRLDARDDAHGRGGARRSSATTASSCPACTRSARRSRRARPTCPGPATRPRRSRTSPSRARSGRSAPATAATPCSARSASPCASPRSWRTSRAGSPSTC